MIYKCKTKNCDNIINPNTWKYGSRLCGSCAQKGKKLSKETKIKIAKASKKHWKDPKYKKRVSKAISKSVRGKKRKPLTIIHKQNISKSLKGKFLGKNTSGYIDGRCSKKYYCNKCGKEIKIACALRGSGFCKSCSQKGRKLSKNRIKEISLSKGEQVFLMNIINTLHVFIN